MRRRSHVEERPPLRKPRLIREHVAGKNFIDVGGLWGTTGEMVTHAALAGAASVTMADIQQPDNKWWQAFRDRCVERGVEGCAEVHADICAPDAPERLGKYDFVHSSGIMYHVADLFGYVSNLIAISREYLLLSSATFPDRIRNRAGTVEFGPDNAFLAPTLNERDRAVISTYLQGRDIPAAGVTYDARFIVDGRVDTGPWWWLFSNEFMSRFVTMYGLEVLAEGPSPTGRGYTVLARIGS